MKEYQKVSDFLDAYQGWKIHRVHLVQAIHRWANKECTFRISTGSSRVIIMKCLFHNEKTPSLHIVYSKTDCVKSQLLLNLT